LIDGKIKTHGNLDYAIDLYLGENRINSQMFFAKSELKRNQIKSITLKDPINDLPKKRFFMNENIKIEIEVISDKILENFDLSLRLNDQINTKIASWRSSELGIKLNMDYSKSIIIIIKNLNVFEGIYNFSVSLTKNDLALDFIENAIEFEILPAPVILKNKIIPKYNCLIYTESEWIC
jgi:hypothetical protein